MEQGVTVSAEKQEKLSEMRQRIVDHGVPVKEYKTSWNKDVRNPSLLLPKVSLPSVGYN